MDLEIKNWLIEKNIPLTLMDKKDVEFLTEEENRKLAFNIYNKKGTINIFKVPVDEKGNVLDPLYNLSLPFKNNQDFIFIEQEDSSDSSAIGLQNLKIKDKNKDIFLTISPLDRLFLSSIGLDNVLSVPPDVFLNIENTRFFEELNKKVSLKDLDKIYLCFPDLPNKLDLEEKIATRLDKNKILKMDLSSFSEELDFKPRSYFNLFELFPENNEERKFLPEYIVKKLKDGSEPFPIEGIYQFSDFESKVDSIYKNGLLKGAETGWSSLDEIYRPKTKHVTVVYGIPESGKTLFVKNLSLNLAKTVGWKTGFFSFEDDSPENFYHEMIEKLTGELSPFNGTSKRTKEVLERTEYVNAKKFIQQNIKLILPSDEMYGNESFLDGLLGLFEKAISIYGIKNVVLDPWNQIFQGKPTHLSESEFLSICLGKVNQFAQKNDVHVVIVSHPKVMPKEENGEYKIPTLYDLSGGAQWFNKISVGICIYRRNQQVESRLDKIIHIYVQKRKNRTLGKLGFTYLATGLENETLFDCIDKVKYTKYFRGNRAEKVSFEDFLDNKKGLIKNNKKVQQLNQNNVGDLFLTKGDGFEIGENRGKNGKKDLPF